MAIVPPQQTLDLARRRDWRAGLIDIAGVGSSGLAPKVERDPVLSPDPCPCRIDNAVQRDVLQQCLRSVVILKIIVGVVDPALDKVCVVLRDCAPVKMDTGALSDPVQPRWLPQMGRNSYVRLCQKPDDLFGHGYAQNASIGKLLHIACERKRCVIDGASVGQGPSAGALVWLSPGLAEYHLPPRETFARRRANLCWTTAR